MRSSKRKLVESSTTDLVIDQHNRENAYTRELHNNTIRRTTTYYGADADRVAQIRNQDSLEWKAYDRIPDGAMELRDKYEEDERLMQTIDRIPRINGISGVVLFYNPDEALMHWVCRNRATALRLYSNEGMYQRRIYAEYSSDPKYKAVREIVKYSILQRIPKHRPTDSFYNVNTALLLDYVDESIRSEKCPGRRSYPCIFNDDPCDAYLIDPYEIRDRSNFEKFLDANMVLWKRKKTLRKDGGDYNTTGPYIVYLHDTKRMRSDMSNLFGIKKMRVIPAKDVERILTSSDWEQSEDNNHIKVVTEGIEYGKWFQTEKNDEASVRKLIAYVNESLDRIEDLDPMSLWEMVRTLGYINHSAFKVRAGMWEEYPDEMLTQEDADLNNLVYSFKTYALDIIVDYYLKHELDISTDQAGSMVILRDPITANRQITFHVGKDSDITKRIPVRTGSWDGVRQAHHYSNDDDYIKARGL